MPVMNGPDTANILRNKLSYQGILCGVSGNTSDDDVKRFLDNGASFVLSKPLDLISLKSFIPQL